VSPFDGATDDTLIGEPPTSEPATSADELGPDELIPLTILQRGVDLLNVSAVPKRIVETNENLGMPQVHVGSQGESTLLVTFMWSMGWYQFQVELARVGSHLAGRPRLRGARRPAAQRQRARRWHGPARP